MNTNLLYVKVDDIKAEIQKMKNANDKYDITDYSVGYEDALEDVLKLLNTTEEPKKSKVTKELREEVIEYMCGLYEDDGEPEEDGFYLFFKRCKDAGIDHGDADTYAWLNTLMGYNIGLENARKIDIQLWDGYSTAVSNLTYKKDSEHLLKAVCYDLKLELDFSKWAKENPECYKYFEEE